MRIAMGFDGFHRAWLREHRRHLRRLRRLLAARGREDQDHGDALQPLVDRVVAHYDAYFHAKTEFAEHDVLAIFDAAWATTFERPFQWIAGWRPTLAFHLFYSESGLRLETRLPDIHLGRGPRDLAHLQPTQLQRIGELHLETVAEERRLTARMADWQDRLGDSDDATDQLDQLRAILEEADRLRLATGRRIVHILTPLQAVGFLTAAAELQIGIRRWGEEKDGVSLPGPHDDDDRPTTSTGD